MKLLFDQNLSPQLVEHLSDICPDSNRVYRLGIDRAPDLDVWEHARREGFLIVTRDADFSDMCTIRGFPPKVIWIRRGNCKTSEIERILRDHYSDIEALVNDRIIGVLTLA